MNIEKEIPIPRPRVAKGGELTILMAQMQPGDSVLATAISRPAAAARAHLMWGAGAYATRKDGEAVRLWRTK